MQTLYWCITVKREQSGSAQLLIYLHEMFDSLGNCVLSDVVVHLDISSFLHYFVMLLYPVTSVPNNSVSSDMRDLTLVNWNVKGLGHVVKRDHVLSHLKFLEEEIIFLKETHASAAE